MATTRMLRSSRPLRQVLLPTTSTVAMVKCVTMAGLVGEIVVSGGDNSKRKPIVAVKAISVVASESLTVADKEAAQRIDLVSLLAALSGGLVRIQRPVLKGKPRKFQAQRFIERVIANCRFFTMFAVAGTLLGSLLCFVEPEVLKLVEELAMTVKVRKKRKMNGKSKGFRSKWKLKMMILGII